MLCELATTLSNDKMFAFTVRLVAKFFLAKQWHALHPEIRRQEQLVLESPPSNSLVKLLVSGEDRRHGTHAGLDIRAIIRATIHNSISKSIMNSLSKAKQRLNVLLVYHVPSSLTKPPNGLQEHPSCRRLHFRKLSREVRPTSALLD